MVHGEIAQNRSAGAGTAKIYTPKYDSIVTRQFCNFTKEALPATAVDATGRVWLLLSVWSECHEMRISGAHYLRVQLLCCCQRENKTSRVAILFLNL